MQDVPSGQNTECKLLNAAQALFSEKGYKGASIREIIERAGVTRPVLYYYFKNKEDLFCRLVESSFAELGDDLDEILRAPGTCRSRLKSLMTKTFARAEESPELVRLLLQAIFSNGCDGLRLDTVTLVERRLERVAAIIQGGLDAGELAGGDAPAMAMAFLGMMDMHIMLKTHRPQMLLTPQLAENLVALFFAGAGGGVYAYKVDMGHKRVAETCES